MKKTQEPNPAKWLERYWLPILLLVLLAELIILTKMLMFTGGIGAGAALRGLVYGQSGEILKIMVGLPLAIIALYFSLRRTKVLDDTLRETRRNTKALEDTLTGISRIFEAEQLQTSLKDAIEHLGNADETVRIGGIYELRQLTKDYPEQCDTVQRIYCSYLRKHTNEREYIEAYSGKKPAEEVQVILDILSKGSEAESFQSPPIQLQGARLQEAHLLGAKFLGADLQGANLQKADLQWANLQGAKLQGADLQGANLQGAKLQEAHLLGANLQGARLKWANLHGAELGEAELEEAKLKGAIVQATGNETDEIPPEKLKAL